MKSKGEQKEGKGESKVEASKSGRVGVRKKRSRGELE
jgi:hypothetical protein